MTDASDCATALAESLDACSDWEDDTTGCKEVERRRSLNLAKMDCRLFLYTSSYVGSISASTSIDDVVTRSLGDGVSVLLNRRFAAPRRPDDLDLALLDGLAGFEARSSLSTGSDAERALYGLLLGPASACTLPSISRLLSSDVVGSFLASREGVSLIVEAAGCPRDDRVDCNLDDLLLDWPIAGVGAFTQTVQLAVAMSLSASSIP